MPTFASSSLADSFRAAFTKLVMACRIFKQPTNSRCRVIKCDLSIPSEKGSVEPAYGGSGPGNATAGPGEGRSPGPLGASGCEISRRGSRFWASIADVCFKLGRHRPATSESAGFGHGH
jgi:hypothetical protein